MPQLTQRYAEAHDDMQGIIGTSLVGATAFTPRLYRNTGIALPHMADGDVFTFNCQIFHRKKMGTNADSFHMHYIPIASANGTILFDISWGWYNLGETIPDTLPNTATGVELTLATTDQYKYKIFSLATNLTPPTNEGYGSWLFFRFTRNGGTWGALNEIAVMGADAHVIVNRYGSLYEYSDTI